MKELNKKLAKWAGFTFFFGGWKYPDGTKGISVNFPESLDACFEWLVPELYKQDYYYELLQWNSGQHKAIINKKTAEWAVTVSDAIAETPALALCLAIEKLIDGEK